MIAGMKPEHPAEVIDLSRYRARRTTIQTVEHPQDQFLLLLRQVAPSADQRRLAEIVDRIAGTWRAVKRDLALD